MSYTSLTLVIRMGLFAELNGRIAHLQEGLQPAHLRYWHDCVISDARAMAPPHLQDKITIAQDEHLPMKFHLDISKRAVTYYVIAVESHLHKMPMSTQLYFMQLCETIGAKIDQQLV